MFKMSNPNTTNVTYSTIIPEKCTKSAATPQKLRSPEFYRKAYFDEFFDI